MSYEPPVPPPPPPGGFDPQDESNQPYSTPPPPPPYSAGPPDLGSYSTGGVQTHPNGTTILVMGILGLVVCSPLGIVAWVMGNNALKQIDASGVVYDNRGSVQAGKILGIIAVVLMVLGVVAFGFMISTGVFLGMTSQ